MTIASSRLLCKEAVVEPRFVHDFSLTSVILKFTHTLACQGAKELMLSG